VSLTAAIQSFASIGVFASRAFLPAFAVAVLARFGPDVPLLRDIPMVRNLQSASGMPAWFTHEITIAVLGILSILEILADKDPDVKQFMLTFDKYAKAAMSALITFGLLTASEQAVLREVKVAGFSETAIALTVAIGVFSACLLRATILGFILDVDDDGSLGLVKLVSIAEDVWAFFGIFLLIVFPAAMLALVALALLMLFVIREALARIEERSKIDCPACGALNYRSAIMCPGCGKEMPEPKAVGLLGRTLKKIASDRGRHALALVENRRCPVCATRLPKRAARQSCPGCGKETISDALLGDYMGGIKRRLPMTLLVCFGFSSIPVIGAVPGVIYYRLRLVAPFRRYIPAPQRAVLRWVVGLISFILLAFQWVPFAGSFSIPLMAFVNYRFYSRAYERAARSRGEDRAAGILERT